jgi:molybdopterin/thiamine biosynthesis adenylyltransferase
MEQLSANEDFNSRTKKLVEEVAIPASLVLRDIPDQWKDFSVFFSIHSDLAKTYAGQLMLLSSVNLVGRFCSNLFFPDSLSTVMAVMRFPFGSKSTLLESCIEIAGCVNPSMTTRVVVSKPSNCVTLGVNMEADVTINSDNWFSYLNWTNTSISYPESLNPFGPLFASCLGSAEVFRKLISALGAKGPLATRTLTKIRFSTLDFSCNDPVAINPPFPRNIDLGSVLFGGSGAVANGAASAIYFANGVRGSLTFLDDESVSLSNVSRYSLSTVSDIGKEKTLSLKEIFADSALSVHSLPIAVESLTPKDLDNFDVVVSMLDNRDHHRARIHMQNLLPKNVIHAATQGLALAIANINFLEGICMGCLFSPRLSEITTIADPICGGVTVQIKGQKEVAAAVSFVSAASGILAASELVKRSVRELNQFNLRNYLSLSLMSPDLADVRYRGKDKNCLCLCSEPIRHEAFKAKYFIKKN